MRQFTTKQITLTEEQRRKLLKESNTHYRKFDVRLVQAYYNGNPLDSFIVQYKVFIAPMTMPEFENLSWSMPKAQIEKIIGKFNA